MATPRKKSAAAQTRKRAVPLTTTPKTGTNGAANWDEAVARLAHQLFIDRGMTHGRDLDDWLEAERQLRATVI